MKNRLTDLNEHLFAQLERLGSEELEDEAIEREVNRSKAIVDIADTMIAGGKLALEGAKLHAQYKDNGGVKLPPLLQDKTDLPRVIHDSRHGDDAQG